MIEQRKKTDFRRQTGHALRWLLTAGIAMAPITGMAAEAADAQNPSPAKPGVNYKGINLQLGGFLASETVFRSNNTASDIGTNYSKLPFASGMGYGMSEFRGTERQSRFSLLAQGDVDTDTQLAGYYELDFLSAATTSNANESNSYTPRTRNVYLTMDWLDSGFHILAGQNWSLVTQNTKGITPRNELIPLTIDSQYAVGFNWARQWQLRFVKDWAKTYWLGLSFENAQTLVPGGTAAGGTGNTSQLPAGNLMSNPLSYNSYPDVIAKFALEEDFGHFEVFNVLRNFQSRYGGTTQATQTNQQNIWTDAVGAAFTVPLFDKALALSANALYGQGIGRYGTTTLSDATYNSDGSLNPMSGLDYLAELTWHMTDQWDIYLAYGQEALNSAAGSGFGYGDGVVASNAGCNTLGGTCTPNLKNISQSNVGFWWTFYKGNFGATKLGMQYSHTLLNTFADAGGYSPTTTEDMIFSSLRYYPF